ncbi:MAG TPA: signal peptidase I [Caulobacterales bacterium]|nr:signal peptidase I [Caulobacterales bacterium]
MTTAKEARGESLWETVKTIIYALALAMCIRFVFVQPFRIPSGSMQPTLLVGDYMVVSKWSYGYSRFSVEPFNFGWPAGRIFGHEPQRGDVVVFRPVPQEDKDLVKRLIGLPGDKIQYKDSQLYINGTQVQRTSEGIVHFKDFISDGNGHTVGFNYIDVQAYRETLPNGVSYLTFDRDPNGALDKTDVFEVPPGNYFFMGDDRDNSADSRTSQVGYVPFENLVGKAQFVFVSFDPLISLLKPWTIFTGFRGDRVVHHVN